MRVPLRSSCPVLLATLFALGCDEADGVSDTTSGTDADTSVAADTGPDTSVAMDTGAETLVPSGCDEPFDVVASPPVEPPFSGTAYVTNELLSEADPTSFVDLTYTGQASRLMFDRRVAAFVTLDAHTFDARFGARKTIEIQVNPEMSQSEAEAEARYYAAAIGRIPGFLFRDIDTVWIHRGMQPFGGGNRNLLIHTEQGQDYATGGSLEEIFVHEAAHTSMDAYHVGAARWIAAREADGVAISTYARDNPTTEDVSESLGPYLALRFGADRVAAGTLDTIRVTMPNRIRYLDCLGLSMDRLP